MSIMVIDIKDRVEPTKKDRASSKCPSKVLLVSKEESLRTFEARICHEVGFEVIHARWGDEALELYKEYRPFIAVITDLLYDWSDWRLAMRGDGKSVKNGLQLAVAIRRLNRKQRIVIQTYAAMDHVSKNLTRDLAGVHILRKPFRPEELSLLLKGTDAKEAG